MRFTTAAAITGLAAVAVAESNGTWSEGHGGSWGKSDSWSSTASDVYVTEVVTAFTTYCPEATQITHGGSTYSVTSATTLTITNCPGGCTITKPVSSSTPVSSSAAAPVTTSSSAVVPSKPVSSAAASSAKASVGTVAPYKPSNGTAVTTAKATGTGSWTSASASATSVAPYKGAATKASFGIAGLIAAVGFVAAL